MAYYMNRDHRANSLTTLLNFFKHHDIKINKHELKVSLNGAAYHSPREVVIGLEDLNIQAHIIRDIDIDTLPNFALPVIGIFIKEKKFEYVLILDTDTKNIRFVSSFSGIQVKSKEEFSKPWINAIIKIDLPLQKKTALLGYGILKSYRHLVLFLLSFFVLLLLRNQTFIITSLPPIVAITSLIGSIISFLLLFKDNKISIGLIDRVCSLNAEIACDEVLNSKFARLFFNVKLHDLSGIFFLTCLSLYTASDAFSINEKEIFITLLYILALPVALLSIALQSIVLRKYCLFCLSISTIIFLNFLLTINRNLTFSTRSLKIIPFAEIVVSVILLWMIIKSLAALHPQIKAILPKLKIIQGFDFFFFTLNQQKKVPVIEFENEIRFGNPGSLFKITAIIDLNCSHCKKTYPVLRELQEMHEGDFVLNIRFTNSSAALEKILTYYFANKAKIKLRELFDLMASGAGNSLPTLDEIVEYRETAIQIISQTISWCKKNDLQLTPTLLINEKVFPRTLDIKNINRFFDKLKESIKHE